LFCFFFYSGDVPIALLYSRWACPFLFLPDWSSFWVNFASTTLLVSALGFLPFPGLGYLCSFSTRSRPRALFSLPPRSQVPLISFCFFFPLLLPRAPKAYPTLSPFYSRLRLFASYCIVPWPWSLFGHLASVPYDHGRGPLSTPSSR